MISIMAMAITGLVAVGFWAQERRINSLLTRNHELETKLYSLQREQATMRKGE